jgi:dipeptidyl aminopeptidase/acylaminoacyl peptidase
VDRITAAVIVFQGLDDPVVPPEQAELIVEALRNRGVEYEYHAYEGESHGFRKAETIIDSLNAELAFYARVLA